MILSKTPHTRRICGVTLLMTCAWFAELAAPVASQTSAEPGAPMVLVPPTQSPATEATTTAVKSADQDDWFGQAPLSTLPSPATESLTGRWQGGTLFGHPSASGGIMATQNAQPAPRSTIAPPPPPVTPTAPVSAEDHDRFTAIEGGYSIYENDRYGTFISYPAEYFRPEAPPGNADGRRFVSVDGTAAFYVFAQFNALGLTQAEMIAQDKQADTQSRITYERAGPGWYVLSGFRGTDIFYRRVISDGPDGLIRVFEISYPAARKTEFDAILTYMANSFGPGSSSVGEMSTTQPDTTQAAMPGANQVRYPTLRPDALYTPQRGSALRSTLMDVARVPIAAELGEQVIFVVSVFNTDDQWAYLQAKPVQPSGREINWANTPFAGEIQQGVMSDVAMVLMLRDGSEWRVIDHVMGPTDVHWFNWLEPYNLTKDLFVNR